MLSTRFLLCVLALAFTQSAAWIEWQPYDGYQVLGIRVSTRDEAEAVSALDNYKEVTFLNEIGANNRIIRAIVGPDVLTAVQYHLTAHNVRWEVLEKDLQVKMQAEQNRLNGRFADASREPFDINDFNTYEDIMSHTNLLAEQCKVQLGVQCLTYYAGFSVEGRIQKILRMTKEGSPEPRSEIFVDSTIHGNEWLATATMMKIMDHMVNQYPDDPDVARFVDNYDWYFLPVENPDGYSYTWTDDRFWRKSRNLNPGSACNGTDLNRNFGFNWKTGGSSDDPCSNNFMGAAALSEPETKNIADEASFHGPGALVAWISLHTSGNVWVYPYGTNNSGSCDTDPTLNDDLQRAGQAAATASGAVYGNAWQAGTICDVMYVASGTETDHMLGTVGIPYSYTVELRSMPTPDSPEDIEPSFQEAWVGLVALMNDIEAGRQ